MKPGKGAAFVRSKLKNYVTGNTVDRTFRAGESVGTADIERIDTQFTYGEGDTVRSLLRHCHACRHSLCHAPAARTPPRWQQAGGQSGEIVAWLD